jgi:hypothetical protein
VPAGDLLLQDAEAACALNSFWVPPAAILYRRDIVNRIGGWRQNLPVIQDARFLFDAAAQNAKFVHLPGVGALYRVRTNSLSRRSRAGFIRDCVVNAGEIQSYWQSKSALTPRRAEVLRLMWQHNAVSSLIDGVPDFDLARQNHNAIARRRFAIEAGWVLRKIMGAQFAGAIARARLERRAARRVNGQPKI